MSTKSMGEIISTLRREKGKTQKELADMLNITDKAVSKWERDVACPDTQTIPKLAEILGVSVEKLMNAKSVPPTGHKGASYLFEFFLKVVPLAMGIAVVVTSLLDKLDVTSGFTMLGIGITCIGIHLLKNNHNHR
ncbi:MAG: helix-turn-helix transcriptional regulator [Ruminococcaceae bacterium]|nr:helix-turn-helix transcriptional regulator [Oscillospiraceae bacterium]